LIIDEKGLKQFKPPFYFNSNLKNSYMMYITLLFPTSRKLWAFQKLTKTSTLWISEPDLLLKGKFSESEIELACIKYKARFVNC
jgi:hypothetical protein